MYSDLVLRGLTGLFLTVLALMCVYVGGPLLLVFGMVVSALMLMEGYAIVTPSARIWQLLPGWLFFLIISIFLLWEVPFSLVWSGMALAVVFLIIYWKNFWPILVFCHTILFWISFVYIARLPIASCFFLFLFSVVWSTDIGAYFGGRLLGGAKLAPRISPKKTWSGAVCGLIAAIAGGGLSACYCFGYSALHFIEAVGVSALLCVISQAGDIAESFVKRCFCVKDSGNLLPGHGGVLDRVDGLSLATIFSALFLYLANMLGMQVFLP